jgi:hypothetical protein
VRRQVFGYNGLIKLSKGAVGKTRPDLIHPEERNAKIAWEAGSNGRNRRGGRNGSERAMRPLMRCR